MQRLPEAWRCSWVTYRVNNRSFTHSGTGQIHANSGSVNTAGQTYGAPTEQTASQRCGRNRDQKRTELLKRFYISSYLILVIEDTKSLLHTAVLTLFVSEDSAVATGPIKINFSVIRHLQIRANKSLYCKAGAALLLSGLTQPNIDCHGEPAKLVIKSTVGELIRIRLHVCERRRESRYEHITTTGGVMLIDLQTTLL